MYGQMLVKKFSYSRKNIKTNFCGSLILIKQSGDEITEVFVFFLKKMLIIQFPYMGIDKSFSIYKNVFIYGKIFFACKD